jgi:hypothetical protein
MPQPAAPTKHRWFDRMFQIRLPVFVLIVAGCALVCWAYLFNIRYRNLELSLISHQIDTLRTSSIASERRGAAMQLDSVPAARLSEAVPVLMKGLRDSDASVRRASAGSLATSVLRYYGDTKGELPPECDAVSLALVGSLSDSDASVRAAAARALESLVQANRATGIAGLKPAVDSKVVSGPLRHLLNDPNTETARDACRTLILLGELAGVPAETIERLAKSGDLERRFEAISWLGQAVSSGGCSVDRLIALLDDPKLEIRLAAIRNLDKPRRQDAIHVARVLAARLTRKAPGESGAIAFVLVTIVPLPDDVVPALIALLDRGEFDDALYVYEHTVECALAAIANASPAAAKSALPAMARVANRYLRKNNRLVGIKEIIAIDPDSPEAQGLAPSIADALVKTTNHFERKRMIAMLKDLKSDLAKQAVPTLRRELADANREVLIDACESLAELGPLAKDAAPDLDKLARKSIGTDTLTKAASALLAVAPGSDMTIEFLLFASETATKSKEIGATRVSDSISMLFSKLTSQGVNIRSELAAALTSSDPKRRTRAEAAMIAIDQLSDFASNKEAPNAR